MCLSGFMLITKNSYKQWIQLQFICKINQNLNKIVKIKNSKVFVITIKLEEQ